VRAGPAGGGRPREATGGTDVEGIAEWSLRFLEEHAELALFLFLLLEESGIPMPVPGDLVVLLAGVRVGQERMNFVVALLAMQAGTVLGSSFLYWVARRGGRPMLYRYGKFVHLELDKLAKAEDFLRRRGGLAIAVGRLIPGLRIPTTLAAGAFRMPYLVFLPAAAIGSDIYNLLFFLLGYFFGPGIIRAVQGVSLSLHFVVVLLGLGVVIAAFVAIRRRSHLASAAHALPERSRLETALMAGLLATATTSLVLDLVLYAVAALGQTTPVAALVELGRTIGARFGARATLVVVGGITLYVVLQLLWAVLYAHVERWLPEPDWLGGLLFALLPLVFSLLVVLPALGAGVAGLGLGMGLVPLAGEVLRHALYGGSLSVSYTLLSRARAARKRRGAQAPLPAE
jgi:membrane protein DedA with SNARE-associated domain